MANKDKLDKEISITKEGITVKNYSVKDIMLMSELIILINAGGAAIEKQEEEKPGKIGFKTGDVEEGR